MFIWKEKKGELEGKFIFLTTYKTFLFPSDNGKYERNKLTLGERSQALCCKKLCRST